VTVQELYDWAKEHDALDKMLAYYVIEQGSDLKYDEQIHKAELSNTRQFIGGNMMMVDEYVSLI
jgi:hypothetical protein